MYYKQIYCPRQRAAGFQNLFEELIYNIARPNSLTTRKIQPTDISPLYGVDGTDVWIAWEDDWSECIIFNEEIEKIRTPNLEKLFRFLKENAKHLIGGLYNNEKNAHEFLSKDGSVIIVTLQLSSDFISIKDEDGNELFTT